MERSIKVFSAVFIIALLTAPARAQVPSMNLIPETISKTPEEKEADEAKDRAYKESLKKIPDAKVSSDPWGTVRTDPPKATPAKAAPAKAAPAKAAPAKPRTKTGSTAN
jgi:hypothetical protein